MRREHCAQIGRWTTGASGCGDSDRTTDSKPGGGHAADESFQYAMEHGSTCLLPNLLRSIAVSSAAISSKAIRKLLRQSFPGKRIRRANSGRSPHESARARYSREASEARLFSRWASFQTSRTCGTSTPAAACGGRDRPASPIRRLCSPSLRRGTDLARASRWAGVSRCKCSAPKRSRPFSRGCRRASARQSQRQCRAPGHCPY